MKTVRDACVLKENALSIKLSDQIEQLDELISAEGGGNAFFKEKTFITQGMADLIREGIARLAGNSSQAVFHLKQAMGGGKTHLLVGLGLLAKSKTLRENVCPDVAYISDFGSARVAAFNGRNSPDHFFWGEIASQFGRPELFKSFWEGGPKAPDEKDWLTLFDGDDPTLILLDELPPYFAYYVTQKVGNGTVADIVTRAFANLLTAAGKKANVCVVVADLAAVYKGGGSLINSALEDAASELGRQERNITPVDLSANEIFEILKKRLFDSLPTPAEVDAIAAAYGNKLAEAQKAKTVSQSAEAIADDIKSTYPFHPRSKNIVALFKENEKYKQTRGLIELISRLLRSVWERSANDVFLIGPQHFDLSIQEVRDKLTEISGMQDVIAHDLWDSQSSAVAQIVDLDGGTDYAAQVGSLLLTASLSDAVNAVKGLTIEELVECLVSPLAEPSDFKGAFDALETEAWYLHHTPEGRFYFDKQENLTKLLKGLASDAPQNKIDDLIRVRLSSTFAPTRKAAYEQVLPLPKLEDAAGQVSKGRVLLVVGPDAKIPPEEVRKFFEGITQKNNLCVLTGDKTEMGSLDKAARQVYAAEQAEASRIPKGHPQREELEHRREAYEHYFTATILSLFNKVLFPRQPSGQEPKLEAKPLDVTRDGEKPFNGEEQIEKTLAADPLKLYLDVEKDFDPIRDKAQDLLWPVGQDDAPWADIVDRYAEKAGMPWLPPKGLDNLKALACSRGLWEDLQNGHVTKKPKKKSTSVQVTKESGPDDAGKVRLRVSPQNAGPVPKIYFAEDDDVSEASDLLHDDSLETAALRIRFLAVDPSGQYETGGPVTWENQLTLRNHLTEKDGHRVLELLVAPMGDIRYTLDGTEPRDGTAYVEPIEIGDGHILVRVFAEADTLEAKEDFTFPAKADSGVKVDPGKKAALTPKIPMKLDSRQMTFEALSQVQRSSGSFQGVVLTAGQGNLVISLNIGDISIDGKFIEDLLHLILEQLESDVPVTMAFSRCDFASGHDLVEFAKKLGIELKVGDVQQ